MSEVKKPITQPKSEIPMANPAGPAVIKRDIEAELRKQYELDQKPVRGIFKYHECPGGMFEFSYRKYKWEQVRDFKKQDGTALYDEQIYTLPLGIAKHLNKACSYPIHKYLEDESGKKTVAVEKRVQRVSFQSLEFHDFDEHLDLQPTADIVTVKQIAI